MDKGKNILKLFFLRFMEFTPGNVSSPFVQYSLHILRDFGFEINFFSGCRMDKSQRPGMQCLPWEYFETILNELFILCESSTTENLISTVFRIIKERMFNILEVHPDLVCTPCLKPALNQVYIIKSF